MLDLACHAWCRPFTVVTGSLVRPFVLIDRYVPPVRKGLPAGDRRDEGRLAIDAKPLQYIQAMTDHEQLAGYDDDGTDGASEPRALDHPPGVPAASSPELRTLVAVVLGAVVVATLYVAQDILIPITLAVMLSFVLSPLVELLRRIGLWRAPAVGLSVLVALGAIGLIGTLLGSQAATLAADVPQYVEAVRSKVQSVQALATTQLASLTGLLGAAKPAATPVAPPAVRPRGATPDAAAVASGGTHQRPLVVEIATPQSSAFMVARAIIEPVLGPLETTVIVLIVAIFILMQREDLRDRFIRLFGSTDLHRTTIAMNDAGQRLSRYFVSQLAVNACFGAVIGAGLWLIGVPSAALWGVLAGLLRFVPYVGPLLAAVAPLTLAAAVDSGWGTAVYVALLFVIVEPLTGYVVEPLLYGHSTGLSPMSVIVAAVFWTWMWGPVGLILSTPLTLCLVVMGRHVKSLEFFDVLLGDRPALSEVNRFYQRTLANDPDEALDQAETLLATRSLLDYYDTVVLPGLRLAAADEARGTISRARAAEMTRFIFAIISDLQEHVDAKSTQPSDQARIQGTATGLVACVAGRGPFDDVVSAMLAQLLAQRGVKSRRIPHSAVSREMIARLDVSDVKVITVSCLELEGAPAHLRYLIRRLRDRAPHATLIAGLWPKGETVSDEPQAPEAVGGNRHVASLREAIDASLAALSDPVAVQALAASITAPVTGA
jgi:predicted PurR-regulated permease PerM